MAHLRNTGLTMAMLLASPCAAIAATPGWTVSETTGAVSIGAVGKARKVARGTVVAPGDMISTGANSRVVLTRGKEYVIVSPGSRLRVPISATSGSSVTQWIEDLGTAIFRIERKSTPHFGVATPYLAAVVKGTTFSVTVGAAGASVQVVEGAVEVATLDGGATDLIRPGDIARVSSANRFRLTVDGATRRVIDSFRAGTVPRHAPEPALEAANTIVVAVEDDAPDLNAMSEGLVQADRSVDSAMIEAMGDQMAMGRPTTSTPPGPAESVQPDAPGAVVMAAVAPPAPIDAPVVTPPAPVEVAVVTPAAVVVAPPVQLAVVVPPVEVGAVVPAAVMPPPAPANAVLPAVVAAPPAPVVAAIVTPPLAAVVALVPAVVPAAPPTAPAVVVAPVVPPPGTKLADQNKLLKDYLNNELKLAKERGKKKGGDDDDDDDKDDD